MKKPSVYCESFGCQMNAFDTEVIEARMEGKGFDAARSPDEADVVIVNTCSVREHAENRAIARLQELSRSGKATLVVCGCMAQRLGKELFELVPSLSIVAGTDAYEQLPELIREVLETGARAVNTERREGLTYALGSDVSRGPACRYLSVTRGCANYCSYCIVPYLRGGVRSKVPDTVVEEARELAAAGAKEVTLLGQDVMAYASEGTTFAGLLRRVLQETDLRRIRFLTSHPGNIDIDVFHLMAEEERLCPHIHLPLQSGSDRILGLMKRGYTAERYISDVRHLRRLVPGIAVTSDIIVGFPTETENDFLDTLELAGEVRFEAAFTFKYSPREGTAAASMKDDVDIAEKERRLGLLNKRIAEIRRDLLCDHLGSEDEILLDGRVQKGEYRLWKGRTPHFRNVIIAGDHLTEGEIVRVKLKRLKNFTFEGKELARR